MNSVLTEQRMPAQNHFQKVLTAFIITIMALIAFICVPIAVSANNHDVKDDAGVLNQQTQDYIKSVNDNEMAKIKGHPQIAVMTIKSTDGEPIEDKAHEIFQQYQFGTKGYDNGVLLLIATKDHKVRMQTGYGIEGVLPDAYVNTLMSDQVKSDFKKGDFSAGTKSMVGMLSAKITKDQSNLRSKSDVEKQANSDDFGEDAFLYIGLTIAGVSGIIFGGASVVTLIDKQRKRTAVTNGANIAIDRAIDGISKKLKPDDQSLVKRIALKQLREQNDAVDDVFTHTSSLEQFIDSTSDRLDADMPAVTKFINYIINYYVVTALAQKQAEQAKLNISKSDIAKSLVTDKNDTGPYQHASISDDFSYGTDLTTDQLEQILDDYYQPATRLIKYLQVQDALSAVTDKQRDQLVQAVITQWKTQDGPKLAEDQKYLSLDTDTVDQIVDHAVSDVSAKMYFNGIINHPGSLTRRQAVNQLTDNQEGRPLREIMFSDLIPLMVNDYLSAVHDTTVDKLDSEIDRQRSRQIDKQFDEKLKSVKGFDANDSQNRQFISGLSSKQKQSLLDSDNFNSTLLALLALNLSSNISNQTQAGSHPHSDWYHHESSKHDHESHWFDYDDDDDDSFWGGSSSGSSWGSDDDSWSGGGSFGSFDGGGSFGGGGGFDGGGGGTAGW